MDYEYIQERYKVPAEYGRRVRLKGIREGIIIKDMGNYIGVNFDDMKPGKYSTCHPTWEMEYLDIGEVRPMTRGQERYQKYIESEYSGTFAEYLGIV